MIYDKINLKINKEYLILYLMLSWTVKRSFSSSWNILGAFPTLKSVVIYHVFIS